jgi:hypothetical protein
VSEKWLSAVEDGKFRSSRMYKLPFSDIFQNGVTGMDVNILKIVGQVAGIGGLALGVFLILFREVVRKNIFPKLPPAEAYRLLRLVTVATWSVAVIGIVAWVYIQTTQNTKSENSARTVNGIANTGTQTFSGPVIIDGQDSMKAK